MTRLAEVRDPRRRFRHESVCEREWLIRASWMNRASIGKSCSVLVVGWWIDRMVRD